MKNFYKISCIVLLAPLWLSAQLPANPFVDKDTLVTPVPGQLTTKRFGRAAGKMLLANLIPWSYDKYVAQANSADVTFKSVQHNLNPGNWGWDDGNFSTNQFAHPYHGSISFNAYRSNGYSFWQSVPGAFAGSYIWETAAESLDFSINDFINTSYGGIIIGEMTHRLANRLINQRSTGIKRQASEVLAMVINPANGLNRLLDGKWGTLSSGATQPADSSKIYAELDIGVRRIRINKNKTPVRWSGRVKLTYGTPLGNLKAPFSYLSIDAEFGKDLNGIVSQLSIYGSLAGWHSRSDDRSKHICMLTANYEYINNEVFLYSAQSIKFNLLSDRMISDQFTLRTAVGVGPILLAAVPNSYSEKERPYDYCSGASFNASGYMSYRNRFFYGISYRAGLFKTLSGNSSYHLLHALAGDIRFSYNQRFSIGIEPGYLNLKGKYKYYDDINDHYAYLRFSVRYSMANL